MPRLWLENPEARHGRSLKDPQVEPRQLHRFQQGVLGGRSRHKGPVRKRITDAAHAALKRLQVDYLDLYFCHRPDIDTPIETVRAMRPRCQGKILYWGVGWSAQQLTEAYGVARDLRITPPTMEQPQYNLFERQKVEGDYLPLYDLIGLGTTIWSPLASGVLTGKYNRGMPDDSRMNLPGYEWLKEQWTSDAGRAQLAKVAELASLAEEIGISITHLALVWCLSNRNVSTVILGASRMSQLQDNLAALTHRDKLTPDVLARIETIVGNKPAAAQRF